MRDKAAWVILALLSAAVLGAAAGLAGGGVGAAQAEPRFSRLDIAVWPEYDRPLALVIIQGELDPGTVLPARLALHIPAAAGQPSAVASGSGSGAGLVNREHETTSEGDSVLVTFETPDPIVRVEFYVPLTMDGIQRDFTYVWPGDLAADGVTLRAQLPVGAQDFQTEPELGPAQVGQDGLQYRETTLGALGAGQTLSFRVQYAKEDPRLTVETVPAAEPSGGGGVPLALPVLAAVAAVALVGVGALAWYRYSQRQPAPAHVPRGRARGGAVYCTQCGQALSSEDRFCSKCGTPVRR